LYKINVEEKEVIRRNRQEMAKYNKMLKILLSDGDFVNNQLLIVFMEGR